LSEPGDGKLFISGCADNMGQFFPLIDIVVLLSVPVATLMERLAARPLGGYGHSADEGLPISSRLSNRYSGNPPTMRSTRGGQSTPQLMKSYG
jgi:hypothetical protein